MDVTAVLKRGARYAWTALAFLIISYALLVVIGRLLLPTLEHRQELIGELLSQRLGVEIATEHLGGSWERLTPRLRAQSLSITSQGDAPAITISSVQSDFDLLGSILSREMVWHDLSIGEVKLTLRENAEGRWFISNFPISGLDNETNSQGQMDVLTNIILLSTHIGIEQIAINTAFYDGTTTTLFISNIQIESNGDFHRARAHLSLNEAEDRAELLIEGRGDPKDWLNFDGKAYINFNRVNLRNALGIVLRSWPPLSALPAIADSATLLNAELWITSLKPGHFELRGKVQADEIPLSWSTEIAPITNLDTTLTGWFTNGKDWGLQCQGLRFEWDGIAIKPLNMQFQQGLGKDWNKISLAADHINLDTLKHGLIQSQFGGAATAAVTKTLSPSGHLQGLQLSLDLEKPQPFTHISARIESLSLNAWHSTPAVRGLQGYLHWQDNKGYFDLDTSPDFAMHYPGIYTHFMHYGVTQGRVNVSWRADDSSLQVAGGPIDIHGEEGDIRAYISLDIPTTNGGREPQMWLQAGIKNGHSRYLDNYLPAILDPGLRNWLDSAIGDTDIVAAGFIWRGSLNGTSQQQRSIQLYGQFANGNVNYDPSWPKLSELSGNIILDDTQLIGTINSAKAGAGTEQAHLNSASIATLPGALLAVKANVSSPLNTAQQILLNSPLAPQLSVLADWTIAGQTQAKLDLVIPLSNNRQGESYRVEANIDGGRMQLRSFEPVVFSALGGSIAYNGEDGLHSTGVNGTLWGQALNATIASQDGRVKIAAKGLFDLSKAPDWQALFTENVTGTAAYTASFVSPSNDSPATLTVRSDLQNIAIALPAPLNKPAGHAWPLETTLQFRQSDLLIAANTDKIKAQLRIANRQLASGTIVLGDKKDSDVQGLPADKAPAPQGLLVTGHIPQFHLSDWLTALQTDTRASQNSLPSFNTHARVEIDHVSAAGFSLDAVKVDAQRRAQLWDITIDSPHLAGHLRVPEDSSQAIVARLNHIVLPKPELDSGQSLLDDLDPSTLPALDFSTDGLRIGDKQLGNLAFKMRADEQGVSIDQIEADITGITLATPPGGEGTQLLWRKIDGEHQSQFSAALLSDDLGAVLQAWNMPVLLTTSNAAILSKLSWQGKPWDLSLNTLEGHVALNFDEGRFYHATGTSTNVLLKVIGVINFNTWIRRLKLDFSDLLANGVAYDKLEGGLAFDRGQMSFEEPIDVTLPAAKIRLLGHANLLTETIDAHVVATLPVGTNLPWMVALIGGLPAAAGVYITSKVFEQQVDQISSFSYKLSGDLDQPKIEVDRIFSDKSGHSLKQHPSPTQSPP